MAEEKNELQAALAQHHLEADLGYTSKSADKEFSRNDPSKKTITFDLQQCLPTPDVHNSIAFYKRQLWTFDLTVHDCDTGQAYAYIWHEALAKRGGNELGSCLYQFLTNDLDKNVKHVVMYSDCCGGQNKNSHIAVMCMVALQDSSHLEVIDHKFLISGHTHMECDTDHMKELERNNFYNFSGLLNGPLINRKTDTDGDKINWRELRWIRYEKGSQTLLAKTTFSQNEPFRVLILKKRKQTVNLRPQVAYKGPVPISVEKKQHLLDLLPYISSSLQDFYLNLKTDQDVIDALSDLDEDEA
nr:unnamed protein product [Callosobruchus chinensis]